MESRISAKPLAAKLELACFCASFRLIEDWR